MVRRSPLATAALILSLAFGGLVPGAQAAYHSHDHHGSLEQLRLNQGQKWITDAPLRKGMEGIRADLAANIDKIHDNSLTPSQYAALADKLNGHVQYMVKNCQLAKEADDQLHLVLFEVLSGAERMKSGDDSQAGAVQVVGALTAYGQYFKHPNWKPLAH
jgi:hypothetical protein